MIDIRFIKILNQNNIRANIISWLNLELKINSIGSSSVCVVCSVLWIILRIEIHFVYNSNILHILFFLSFFMYESVLQMSVHSNVALCLRPMFAFMFLVLSILWMTRQINVNECRMNAAYVGKEKSTTYVNKKWRIDIITHVVWVWFVLRGTFQSSQILSWFLIKFT